MIDTLELLRVFGTLRGDSQADSPPGLQNATLGDSSACRVMEAELKAVRALLSEREAQLAEAKEREVWLQQHVGEVTGALRLLGHKNGDDTAAKLKKAHETIAKYREALERERNKGFWARLFVQGVGTR